MFYDFFIIFIWTWIVTKLTIEYVLFFIELYYNIYTIDPTLLEELVSLEASNSR